MLFKKTISAVLSLFLAFLQPYTPPQSKCDPKFSGTFIQSWVTCDWSDERWQAEIESMKAAGIEYLIIQDVVNKLKDGSWEMYYNSSLDELSAAVYYDVDVIGSALRNCRGSGIKVIVGLALHDSWFTTAGLTSEYTQMCSLMSHMVEEIHSMYAAEYPDTFYGWYFTPEIWASTWFSASIGAIADGINMVIDAIDKTDAAKPLLLSPFMFENSMFHTLTVALPMWIKFFEKVNLRDGDIFCPQDGVGCDIAKLDSIENVWRMYDAALATCKTDIKLWANCENFTSPKSSQKGLGMLYVETRGYTATATLDRFTQQMKIASRYAENIITFSYNHYYSPNYVNSVFIDTYLDYCENGFTLESSAPTAPTALTAAKSSKGTVLSWSASQDNIGIAYYRICANGRFAGRVEAEYGGFATQFTDTALRLGKTVYTITAFDGAGNCSAEAQITA